MLTLFEISTLDHWTEVMFNVMDAPDNVGDNASYENQWYMCFLCMLLVIFSYLMVVWVTVIGAVIGVSDYIMGLTILASGTSIPDALSSMYMAKEGRGDMAISSSIGSNVFDILVGLPVPTIIKYIVVAAQGNNLDKLARWNFDTAGIVFDTVLLLMMVALIVTSIMLTNWVLNIKLGTMMFLLYFIFLVVCILNKVTGVAT